MSRRVNLPGADELFRSTTPTPTDDADHSADGTDGTDSLDSGASGRIKHDEKMTVYITAVELLAVEQARLTLRSELRRSVDRGRFVRAALAVALADLEERGTDSDIARRLSES